MEPQHNDFGVKKFIWIKCCTTKYYSVQYDNILWLVYLLQHRQQTARMIRKRISPPTAIDTGIIISRVSSDNSSASAHGTKKKKQCILFLTLILMELKVISLCHHYRARPVCTFVQSDLILNCWWTNFKFSFWYP